MAEKKTSKKGTKKNSIDSNKKDVKSLTKYEYSRLIEARALQIADGAPFFVNLSEEELKKIKYNPIMIAEMEYEQGKLPIKIKRNE